MTLIEKIRELLIKYDYDAPKVYEHFEELMEEFDNNIGKDTFKSYVRRERLSMPREKIVEDEDPELTRLIKKYKHILGREDINLEDFEELIKTKSELIKYKNQINRYKREVRALHDSSSKSQDIVDSLRETICQIDLDIIEYPDVKDFKATDKIQVLLVSDAHFGEYVNPHSINNINSYDKDIARERILKTFMLGMEHGRAEGCEEIHIPLLGDMMSGDIHDELKETNIGTTSEHLIELYHILASVINTIALNYKRVYVYGVIGNHSRQDKKPVSKNKVQKTYEYILYKFLEKAFEGTNIVMETAESPVMVVEIGNLKWKLEHGDAYKGGGNFLKLPLMGIARDSISDKHILTEQGLGFDVTAMGHFHTAFVAYPVANRPIICNPSIKGPDEYAVNKLHRSFPASQYSIIQNKDEIDSYKLMYLK